MKRKASVLARHPWFRRLLTGALACAVASALVAVSSVVAELRREADRSTITLPAVPGAIAPTTADSPSTDRLRRPRYRHSVIAGGAFSREEVEDVVREDPVVAAHYRGVDVKRLREAELREPRDVYVSYRIGSQVYWTRRPVRLTVGETLLTDGTSEIRARCGNRISAIPQEPVSGLEPIAEELNERLDPSGDSSVTGERALGPAAPGPVPLLPFLAAGSSPPAGQSGNWAGGGGGSVPTIYPGSTRVELAGDAPTVPEPGILGLLGLGVGATVARWARKRRKESRAK